MPPPPLFDLYAHQHPNQPAATSPSPSPPPRRLGRKKRNRKGRGGAGGRKLKAKAMVHDEAELKDAPLESGGVPGPLALSQSSAGWKAILHDEKRRSFVSIRREAFTAQTLSEWWDLCKERIAWIRPRKEEFILPRSASWLTKAGCVCCYEYGGTYWPPVTMADWFLDITEAVCKVCGITERPNACNANFYGDGTQTVGWHCDNEPIFNSVARDALIISLSLGSSRWFELCPQDDPENVVQLRLENGDLCTMEGLCQKHYRHRVPTEADIATARINLTWRWVVAHEEGCPLSVEREASSFSESGSDHG